MDRSRIKVLKIWPACCAVADLISSFPAQVPEAPLPPQFLCRVLACLAATAGTDATELPRVVVSGLAGKDATEDFEEIGHSNSAKEMLAKYIIGSYEVRAGLRGGCLAGQGKSRQPAHIPCMCLFGSGLTAFVYAVKLCADQCNVGWLLAACQDGNMYTVALSVH